MIFIYLFAAVIFFTSIYVIKMILLLIELPRIKPLLIIRLPYINMEEMYRTRQGFEKMGLTKSYTVLTFICKYLNEVEIEMINQQFNKVDAEKIKNDILSRLQH